MILDINPNDRQRIEITGKQAEAFLIVAQLIGGSPRTTRRRHIASLARTIEEAFGIDDAGAHSMVRECSVMNTVVVAMHT